MVRIDPPAGFDGSRVTDVSDDGTVVVGIALSTAPAGYVAWKWTASTGAIVLSDFPLNVDLIIAALTSGDGGLVAGHAREVPGGSTPFVWTEERSYGGFQDYLTRYGAGPGTLLNRAGGLTALSADGRAAAGVGVDPTSIGNFTWRARNGAEDGIQTATCTHGIPNQTGSPSSLFLDGSPYVAANDIALRVEGLPPQAFTMLVTSPLSGPHVTPPGSIAPLCLSGNIGRFNRASEVQLAGPSGRVDLRLDLMNVPTSMGGTSVSVGQTWHYQAWHRDLAQGMATANFSDAVNVLYR